MNKEFEVHKLSESGIAKAKQIAEEFDKLLIAVTALTAPGREISIFKTKLEEACFFAKKAIAVDPNNQEDEIPF
jgi:hypothetical protein